MIELLQQTAMIVKLTTNEKYTFTADCHSTLLLCPACTSAGPSSPQVFTKEIAFLIVASAARNVLSTQLSSTNVLAKMFLSEVSIKTLRTLVNDSIRKRKKLDLPIILMALARFTSSVSVGATSVMRSMMNFARPMIKLSHIEIDLMVSTQVTDECK